jgi:hypothetical protein
MMADNQHKIEFTPGSTGGGKKKSKAWLWIIILLLLGGCGFGVYWFKFREGGSGFGKV